MTNYHDKSHTIIDRCLFACGCSDLMELASLLGTSLQNIKAAIQNENEFPPEWLLILLKKKDINPRWLLSGKGPVYIHQLTDLGKE